MSVNTCSRQHISGWHGLQLLGSEPKLTEPATAFDCSWVNHILKAAYQSWQAGIQLLLSEHWLKATYQCLARFATAWHKTSIPWQVLCLNIKPKRPVIESEPLHAEDKHDK